MISARRFFAPDLELLALPAWDCLPYDRVSPNGDILARRLDTLTRLADAPEGERIVVTTINAILQRIPPREAFAGSGLADRTGDKVPQEDLMRVFTRNGYRRAGTVREPGEYAVRGGTVDGYPTGATDPSRLAIFGAGANGRGAGRE